jgi:hypothetical protein
LSVCEFKLEEKKMEANRRDEKKMEANRGALLRENVKLLL